MGYYPSQGEALSALVIDIDKDWNGMAVSNLKELAAGMSKGDVLYQDGTRLIKLSPTGIGDELTSLNLLGIGWSAPPGE